MYRCQDGGLRDNDDGLTVDRDYVAKALRALSTYTGSSFDAVWQYGLEIDPFEWMKFRRKQRVYLGRYLKQPIAYWDEVDVTELADYSHDLSELIKSENGSGSNE